MYILYIYIYIYIYTHTHVYIHTYIHTYIHRKHMYHGHLGAHNVLISDNKRRNAQQGHVPGTE